MDDQATGGWTWVSDVARPSDVGADQLDVGQLAEENARLRGVLGNCPKCIAVLDERGLLAGYNREFGDLFALAPTLGAPITALFESLDEAMLADVVSAAGSGDRAAAMVRMLVDGDGPDRVINFLIATLPARDGAPIGVIVAGEEQTSLFREDLERVSTRRSVDQRNCLAALELGRDILGHELATHLAAAQLAIQALLRAKPEHERDQWGAQAAEALEQALALLNHGPKGEASIPTPAAADVRASAEHAIRALKVERAASLARIRNQLPQSLHVGISVHDLVQLLVNLLSNALHAVADKGRFGAVSLFAEDDENGVTLYVRDNGKGIDPSSVASVFELGRTSREHEGGRGFGLALVRAHVHAAGGAIRIISEIEHGTEVVVTLPRAERSPSSDELSPRRLARSS